MDTKKKKVAVVGGGIVGASAAFYLSKEEGIELDLYDEGVGQATSAAAGIICPWLSKRRNKKWYRLVKEGAAMYPHFLKEADVDIESSPIYRNTGTLLFKKSSKSLKEVMILAQKRQKDAPEIGDVMLLSAEEVRSKIPIYEGDQSALFVPGGSRVDGKKMVDHLREKTIQNGASFYPYSVQLEKGVNKRFLLTSEQGVIEYDRVILAVGAWLPLILKPMGYAVDIRPQKGQLVELQISNKETDLWPVVMPEGEMDIIFFPGGKTIIGATHQDDSGYDLSIEEPLLLPMVEDASIAFSSALKESDSTNFRVGTRAYTSDYASFIGEVPGLEFLYTASGLGSTGLTAGPLVGKILAQLVLDEEPELPLSDYPIDQYIQKITPAQQVF